MAPAKRRCAAAVLAWACAVPLAHAEPCEGRAVEMGVPVRVPWDPAALGTLPEACPADSVAATGWGRLLIAEEDYYGQAYAGAAFRVRWRLAGGWWVSALLPGAEYRYVANATVEEGALETSAGAIGVHATLLSDHAAVAPFVRILLPTETAFHNATRWGFEHGVSGTWRVLEPLELVGGFHFPTLITVNGRRTHRLQLSAVSLDAIYGPWDWLAVGAGVGAAARAGDVPGFEAVVPRATIRVYPWRGMIIDLAAGFPVGGEERTDAALASTLGWVL